MRRTFCDRCGGECVNTVGHLYGVIEHLTSGGEQVGQDELKPVDLCHSCIRLGAAQFGMVAQPRELEKPMLSAAGAMTREVDSYGTSLREPPGQGSGA